MDRVAAVDDQIVAGQEGGVGGEQPVDDLADLLRPAVAAHRHVVEAARGFVRIVALAVEGRLGRVENKLDSIDRDVQVLFRDRP